MLTAVLMRKLLILSPLLIALVACTVSSVAYKAYIGEVRQDLALSVLQGASFARQELLNRYVDFVRFSSVDEIPIDNSERYSAIQITPGYHDVKVYFSWDLGSQRGLAPALVNYAASRATTSRTLRFNARAGELYTVRAQPVFNDARRDITTLTYVDFWIVDSAGNEIVTREEGRYVPDL